MAAHTKGDGGWSPAVTLNLDTAGTAAFEDVRKQFTDWSRTQPPLGPLAMQNGWHTITPQIAENFLRRNNGNRRATLQTVKKYARSMKLNDWKGTGQPILINVDGKMEDAQHRCWASYLGLVDFPSYVITDVPVIQDAFAYLDDVKPRSISDALFTSGSNGLSNILAAAIKLAGRYEDGTLDAFHEKRGAEMSVREALAFNRLHPSLGEVAHLMMSDYGNSVEAIGHKAVATLFGWKVMETFGNEALDDFMVAMASEELDADDAVEGFRARLLKEERMKNTLKPPHLLALLIKAFQLRAAGLKVNVRKGLHLTDTEPFPQIEDTVFGVQQAAAD